MYFSLPFYFGTPSLNNYTVNQNSLDAFKSNIKSTTVEPVFSGPRNFFISFTC